MDKVVVEESNIAGRNQSPPLDVYFNESFHPVLVVRLIPQNDHDLSLLKGQLIVTVSNAVIQGLAYPDPAGRLILLLSVVLCIVRETKQKEMMSWSFFCCFDKRMCDMDA